MKIFYHCFGSAHTSVVAASIHVGLIPRSETPSYDEILALPYFDRVNKEQIGCPFFIGRDRWGHEVYTIGMKSDKQVVLNALNSYLKEFIGDPDDVFWVDALASINFVTRIGGYISRGLGCVCLGRPLVIWGILKSYPSFIKLVKQVEKEIKVD